MLMRGSITTAFAELKVPPDAPSLLNCTQIIIARWIRQKKKMSILYRFYYSIDVEKLVKSKYMRNFQSLLYTISRLYLG